MDTSGSDVEITLALTRVCAKHFACPVIGSNPMPGLSWSRVVYVTFRSRGISFCHRLDAMDGFQVPSSTALKVTVAKNNHGTKNERILRGLLPLLSMLII